MQKVPALMAITILLMASLSGCISDETPNKRPEAFAGADLEAEVGEEIVFQGTGLDKDGSIVIYRWDFDGDGSWDFDGDVGAKIHVYSAPGSYEAVLQVEDDEGATAEDNRWVNVTASIHISVDWTESTTFRLQVSQRLDMTRLEVDWTFHGPGPTPITRTFTTDAGIEKVNDTTYVFTVANTQLENGHRYVVHVRFGEVVIARRTIDVVDISGATTPYTARYTDEVWDLSYRGMNWVDHYRSGELTIVQGSGWGTEEFEGDGLQASFTNRTGVLTTERLNLTKVMVLTNITAGERETSWSHKGLGTIEQSGEGGLFVAAMVNDYWRAVENGSLVKDDWDRVGRYSGLNDTNGTFQWIRTSLGNQVRQNGEGELIEVLKVRSEKDFDGTNQGRIFHLNNLSFDYDASQAIFDNRTIWRDSVQQASIEDTLGDIIWFNSTFGGPLDDNGDGIYNPDLMTFDPELASRFVGPRPKVVEVGDTFIGTNLYGISLTYKAKREDTAPMQTSTGPVNVTGTLVEAFHNTTWGLVDHWFWVLKDGPLLGFVYEEQVRIEFAGYGGGIYDQYRNILRLETY